MILNVSRFLFIATITKNQIATVTTVTETVATFHLSGLSVKSVFFSTTIPLLPFSSFWLRVCSFSCVYFDTFISSIFFFWFHSHCLSLQVKMVSMLRNSLWMVFSAKMVFKLKFIYVPHSIHINQIVFALLSQCAMVLDDWKTALSFFGEHNVCSFIFWSASLVFFFLSYFDNAVSYFSLGFYVKH